MGFTRCAKCGGSLIVRSRNHGGHYRAFFYACSSFHHRGRSVCENSLESRIELADETILGDLEQFVLHPKVVSRAIRLALDELTAATPSNEADRRSRLERDLARVQSEISNLTRALAAGGDLPSIIAALRESERKQAGFKAELASLGSRTAFTTRSAKDLERQVLDKLANWRTTLRQEPPQARQVLRKLITDRITFEPTERDGKRLYSYRGAFWFGGLFEGTICPQTMASPTAPDREWSAKFEGFSRAHAA